MDINDTKDRVIQWRKLIIEANKLRHIFEEKMASYGGELNASAREIRDYRGTIEEIEDHYENIAKYKVQAIKYLEGEIHKSVGYIGSWRIVLKSELDQQRQIVQSMEVFVTSDDFDNVDLFAKEIRVFNTNRKHDKSVTVSIDQRMDEIYKLVLNIKSLREQIADVQSW